MSGLGLTPTISEFVVGVDRNDHAEKLRARGADVVGDLAKLLEEP